MLMLLAGTQAVAQDGGERQHTARQTGPAGSSGATTEYRLPALGSGGITRERVAGGSNRKATATINEAYFVDVDIFLDGDFDADGHYYVVDVSWDADTIYDFLDVYAVIWLSYEGGPWEEFVTSDVYTLEADSAADVYRVESELQSGYPTGYYDILIELYDADTGDFLAEVGPVDSAALAELPLEDRRRDEAVIIIHDDHHGGGSLGLLPAITLLGLAYRRRRRAATHESPRESRWPTE